MDQGLLEKTVAARPVRSTPRAAGLTLRHLLAAGIYRRSKRTGSGIGKPAPFREEAPCRRKANPRQATGAAASALGARSCGFLAFHAVERLRFLEKGKPHAYHPYQRWNHNPDQCVHRRRG